ALELDPREVRALSRLLGILRNADRLDEAEALLAKADAGYAGFTPYEQASVRVASARIQGRWLEYLDEGRAQYEISKSEEGLGFMADAESRVHHLHAAEEGLRRVTELSDTALAGTSTRLE